MGSYTDALPLASTAVAPLVGRLLARLPEDHQGREKITRAGAELVKAIDDFLGATARADRQIRREVGRHCRVLLSRVIAGEPIERVAKTYAKLRAYPMALVPWAALNDVIEEVFGEEGEAVVKARAAEMAKATARRESPRPVASVRKR